MPRAPFTVLAVTRDLLVRSDIPRRGAPRCASESRTQDDSLAALTERAAQLRGERLRGRVWVLTDEISAATVSVSAGAVKDLKPEEVGKLLSFEAQAQSGLAAADSAFGWKPAGAEGPNREFRVVQMTKVELDRVVDAVARLGGRLAGILHPGGLPAPVFGIAAGAGPWTRHEIWHGAVVTVRGGPAETPRARFEPGDPSRWRPGANEPGRRTEILMGATLRSAAASDPRAKKLEDPEVLASWAEAWAEVLSKDEVEAPAIRPPARPIPVAARLAIAAGFLLAILSLCLLHHRWLSGARDRLQADYQKANAPLLQLQKIRAETSVMEKQATGLRASVRATGEDLASLDRARRLPGLILRTLATGSPRGLVVDELELAHHASKIRGLCRSAGLPDGLVRKLAEALATTGCRVSPPNRGIEQVEGLDGAYKFEIEIRPPSPVRAGARGADLPGDGS